MYKEDFTKDDFERFYSSTFVFYDNVDKKEIVSSIVIHRLSAHAHSAQIQPELQQPSQLLSIVSVIHTLNMYIKYCDNNHILILQRRVLIMF